MSLYALADRRFTVRRLSAYVLEPVDVAASHSPARQPERESLIQVRISGGSDNAGTVVVSGTVAGAADTETLTFTEAGYQTTVKLFTAITTLVPSGFTGATIEAKALGTDGSPQPIDYVLATDIPLTVSPNTGMARWMAQMQGTTQTGDATALLPWLDVWQPREGDVFVDTISAEQWLVVGKPAYRGRLRPQVWELNLRLRPGST